MSAPTITQQEYELREENTPSGLIRIQAIIKDPRGIRDEVAAKILGVDTAAGTTWLLVCRPTQTTDFKMPHSAVEAHSKDEAIEWLHYLAKLHIRAAAA
ncbi:MAG: hypothetical protein K2Y33_04680 [Mycolicibacterium frederiksbergense]|nr:hypothetical protein [Mycolicibacterium frederiksbergense]